MPAKKFLEPRTLDEFILLRYRRSGGMGYFTQQFLALDPNTTIF